MNVPHERKAPLWHTVRAVLWSFIGLRSRKGFEQDTAQLNPIHLIVTGLVLALFFVLGLLALVHWVVGQPTAL
jgi:polyferredoxin